MSADPHSLELALMLTPDQRAVLSAKARVRKSKRHRYFTLKRVKQKRQCWNLDVEQVLCELQRKEVVRQVGPTRKLWVDLRTEMEHEVETDYLQSERPGIRILSRSEHP